MKSLNRFVLTRVFLAITIAVLVVLTKKEMIWGGFKILLFPRPVFRLWVAFIVLLLLSAIGRVLLEIYRRGIFPRLRAFVDRSVTPVYRRILTVLQRSTAKISFQFLLWGGLIAVIVVIAWDAGSLDHTKINEIRQLPIHGMKVQQEYGSPVTILSLHFLDINQEQYLSNCVKIVGDLKSVGTKAVLVPFDFAYGFGLSRQTEFVRQLNKMGIVVFGNQSGSNFQVGDARSWEVYRYRGGYFTSRVDEYPWYSPIRKIQPIATRLPFSLRKDPSYDVSFELLRLYYGISDEEIVRKEGSHIVFGNLRYPIDNNGNLYVGKHFTDGETGGWPYLWPRLSVSYDEAGRLKYHKLEFPGRLTQLPSLETERAAFDGKIVILGYRGLNWIGGRSEVYARVLHHLIKGETVTQSPAGSLLIALLAIVACGLIIRRGSPFTAVAWVVIVLWVVAIASALLFQVSAVVVDAAYAFAGIAISMVVFSAIRIAHEWRFGVGQSGVSTALSVGYGGAVLDVPKPPIGYPLFARKISLSFPVLLILTVVLVVSTVFATRAVKQESPPVPTREVVYIMGLPTIEVPGVYSPKNEVDSN